MPNDSSNLFFRFTCDNLITACGCSFCRLLFSPRSLAPQVWSRNQQHHLSLSEMQMEHPRLPDPESACHQDPQVACCLIMFRKCSVPTVYTEGPIIYNRAREHFDGYLMANDDSLLSNELYQHDTWPFSWTVVHGTFACSVDL